MDATSPRAAEELTMRFLCREPKVAEAPAK